MENKAMHDWKDCEVPNCEICYPELAAEMRKQGWVEVKPKHKCEIIVVDFKNKRVISRREAA
jgi:hypothetical protein